MMELFGWESEGKWHFGIITNFLALSGQSAKPLLICLRGPMNNTVAHLLANIFDNGRFDTDSKHSFPVPDQHRCVPLLCHDYNHFRDRRIWKNVHDRFVIEATTTDEIPQVLLARCSVISVTTSTITINEEEDRNLSNGKDYNL